MRKLCLILVFAFLCFLSLTLSMVWELKSSDSHCPCEDAPLETSPANNGMVITKEQLVTHDTMCIELNSKIILNLSALEKRKLESNLESLNSGMNGLNLDYKIHLHNTYNSGSQKSCQVLLQLVGYKEYIEWRDTRSLCPGECNQLISKSFPFVVTKIPVAVAPITWFLSDSVDEFIATKDMTTLTCSMRIEEILHFHGIKSKEKISLFDLVSSLFWRRIMECKEEKFWKSSYADYLKKQKKKKKKKRVIAGRRKVDALIIWIGSNNTRSLMERQSIVLQNQPWTENDKAVIGWAADDFTYACNSTKIAHRLGSIGNKRFGGVLPQCAINSMPLGWGCAQRRPLRALAHTLLLFDPLYMVIVDDDTFLNFPLLLKRYGIFLRNDMKFHPIAIGEFMGAEGDKGHLTKKGFYVGGSGYIIGKAGLKQLNSPYLATLGGAGISNKKLKRENNENNSFDSYRSVYQLQMLSVLAEGINQIRLSCSNSQESKFVYNEENTHNTCIQSLKPRQRESYERLSGPYVRSDSSLNNVSMFNLLNQSPKHKSAVLDEVVPLFPNVRLIDFCASLMANEGTCQHSDHSMGRCLFYGAGIIPMGAVCHSSVPLQKVPSDIHIGLCFMAKECDENMHLTCHRYEPVRLNSNHTPIMYAQKLHPNKRGFYKSFSSGWNGQKTDTYI